jgi:hypothetical protein
MLCWGGWAGLARVAAAAEPAVGAGLPATPLAAAEVRQAIQDGRYAEARAAIAKAAATQGAPQDYLTYLGGWSFCLEKRYDEAVAAFGQFEKQFATSAWLRRVRFARGVALARKGDFQAAEAIFRVEAEHLLSPERKAELAEILAAIAGECLRPPKAEQAPDYKRAKAFCTRALAIGLQGQRRAEIALLAAHCDQKLGEHASAAQAYAEFLSHHSASPLATAARLHLGECRLAEGRLRDARQAWRELLAKYPDAASEPIAEAAFHLAETWHVPAPRSGDELRQGIAALEEFLHRFPGHKLAGRAWIEIAQSYLHRQRYEDARACLDRFLKDDRWKAAAERPQAANLLGRALRAQKQFPEALAAWRDFLARYPTHEAGGEVQQQIIDTEYEMAVAAYHAGDYAGAATLATGFLAKYPLDARDPGILFLVGQMDYEQKKWDEAVAAWRRLVSKHPRREEALHARLRIARTLERQQGKFEEALAIYRGAAAAYSDAEATQAVDRLTAKRFSIGAERPFRTSEQPAIRLVSRNLEAVSVRLHCIDLEAYFHRAHVIEGIGDLGVGLIDSDASFEWKIPGYARYKEIESSIPLPLPEKTAAGAVAVTVSGPAGAATAVLVRSDLDIVLKAAGDEVLVFAENLRSGKAWPGVRLLVSNGRQIIAEGATGEDGVWQQRCKDLAEGGTLSVLATVQGHVATAQIEREASAAASGPADKLWLSTDRPAYCRGQPIHVRGCFRRAAGEGYEIAREAKFTIELVTADNRILRREEAVQSPLGTFYASLPLPAIAPSGSYRVVARDEAGHTCECPLAVYDGAGPPVHLALDAARSVVYRGEPLEAVIRASLPDGTPLAGRPIRYHLADEKEALARTDAAGEVRLKLPTEDFDHPQELLLTAMLDEGVQASRRFQLATEGLTLTLGANRARSWGLSQSSGAQDGTPAAPADRPVFLAEESFVVEAKASDKAGAPLAVPLAIKVVELTTAHGTTAEKTSQDRKLATSEGGTARIPLRLNRGGRYVLRAEGVDRFQNTISAEFPFDIAGDDDPQRLRILADAAAFRAGETVEIPVYWREAPALALVVVQGERILSHQLVPLRNGMNRLRLAVSAAMAPRCEVSLAVMTNGPGARFHRAGGVFPVCRDLQVKLAYRAKGQAGQPLRPGEPCEIALTILDPLGKPIAAEVSLALVPRSVFARFPAPVAALPNVFYGSPRQPAAGTASSSTFADHPPNWPSGAELQSPAEEEAAPPDAEAPAGDKTVGSEPAEKGPVEPAGPAFRELLNWIEPNSAPPPAAPEPPSPPLRSRNGRSAHRGQQGGAGMGGMFAVEDHPLDEGSGAGEVPPPVAKPPARSRAKAAAPVVPVEVRLVMISFNDISHEEAGYWNPAVLSGADGAATLTTVFPENPAEWQVAAKAVAAGTALGEAVETLTVRKDLRVELWLPATFTDGDEVEPVIRIQNEALARGAITVTLKTLLAGVACEQTKTIEVRAKGRQEVSFQVSLARPKQTPAGGQPWPPGEVAFEATVVAGSYHDHVRRTAALAPLGMPLSVEVSGTGTGEKSVPLPVVAWDGMRCRLLVSPSIEGSLLDIIFGPEPAAAEAAANELMASLALDKRRTGPAAKPGDAPGALADRIHRALALLIVTQRPHGGWGPLTGSPGDCAVSARAVWALALARQQGYRIVDEPLKQAEDHLRKALAETPDRDQEDMAVLVSALAIAGKGDFALANQLYRGRAALGPRALAYLAIALGQMDRRAMAAEVLRLLDEKGKAPQFLKVLDRDAELHALWALALRSIEPKSPKLQEAVDWLLANRRGRAWAPAAATGPAVLALAQWLAESPAELPAGKLTLLLGDKEIGTADFSATAGSTVIDVPPALLTKGPQAGVLKLIGRGRYAYQLRLSGHLPPERLKPAAGAWQVARTYEPPLLDFDDKPIQRGFSVLERRDTAFHNTMLQLPLGRRGRVTLDLAPPSTAPGDRETPHEDLTVQEPLPAGVRVVEGSIRGGFDRVEVLPGRLVFSIKSGRKVGPIGYEIEGATCGAYRAGPSVLRTADRAELLGFAPPASLAVLPPAAAGPTYRLTPDELFYLGRLEYQKGDRSNRSVALGHLSALAASWTVNAETYKAIAPMLFDLNVELGPAEAIVKYFEVLQQRWADSPISFEQALKVAAAYRAIGEFERSYLVYRAAVEGNFTRETGLPGFLEEQGEFLRSVAAMARLLREYPPEAYVGAAEFALAQRVYAKAPEAAGDASLRRQKVDQAALVRRAWRMLEEFLTGWPTDAAADRAAFAAATALVELKDYSQAADAAAAYARRFPQSELLDSFWYLRAYSDFALGRHQAAMEMCRKVADTPRLDKVSGRPVESANKWQAVYILGQIHQSLGQADEAVREFRRVTNRFPDAKLAVEQFLRRSIELAEVTAVRPGKPAEVELRYCNVAACEVRVYRVDLMKVSAMAATPDEMAQVNLAGVRPTYEASLRLGEGKDYREVKRQIRLPLEKEGAYLVICRGDDLHAGGLLLVTPLELDVQTGEASQQVRVMVRDATNNRCVSGVSVKVLGQLPGPTVSGTTDLGGAFTAEGVWGSPTVIAAGPGGRTAYWCEPSAARARLAMMRGMGLLPGEPLFAGPPAAAPPTAAVSAGEPSGEAPAAGPTATAEKKPALPSRLPAAVRSKLASGSTAAIELSSGGNAAVEEKIREALDAPTSIQCAKTPLADVVAYLKDRHKIEIQLDKKELESMNIGPDAPVTGNLKGISLRSALKLTLDELGLKFAIHNGVLLITSPTKAESEEFLVTKVYPVADLLVGGGEQEGQAGAADFDSLIDLITQTVSPKCWEQNGGQGTIAPFATRKSLAIVLSQTEDVHEQIAALLANLRTLDKEAAGEGSQQAKSSETGKTKPGDLGPGQKPLVISVIPVIDGGRGGAGGFGGMGGGMGGFGGGFGGMRGFGQGMGGMGFGPHPGGHVNLLEGIQNTNRGMNAAGAQRLHEQYDQGQKGPASAGAGFY